MITIRLGCGESITEELSLPHSADGMEVVEGIRGYGKKQGMQVVIQSSESSVITFAPYINGMEYDTQTQKELDFLESRLGHLTRMEQDILSAALKLEDPETLREIINLSYNLDQYEYACDSYIAAYTGDVCSLGLVVKREGAEFTEVYQERLPDPGDEKGALLLLHLYRISDGKPLSYSIALPAEKEKLDMARHVLRINDFSECTVGQYGGPNDELRHFMPVGGSVMELNHFAKSIKEKFLDKGKGSISDLMAVLEAEGPRDMEEASKVADHMERYDILPGIRTAEDYARHRMQKEGPISTSSYHASHVDGESLGEALKERDGVRLTHHGAVICGEWICDGMPDGIVVTRLFSRLAGAIHYMGEEEARLSAYGMAGYEEEIRKGLEDNEIHELERGLAEYLDNLLLKKRIISMFPTVEKYRDDLWGVLEVRSHGELLPKEWEAIKEEWSGQISDGWGETFEQEEIDIGDGYTLCVQFCNFETHIQMEQELKGQAEEQQGLQIGGMV